MALEPIREIGSREFASLDRIPSVQELALGDCMRNSTGLFLAVSVLISCTTLAQEPQPPVPRSQEIRAGRNTDSPSNRTRSPAHSMGSPPTGAFFDGKLCCNWARRQNRSATVSKLMKDRKLLDAKRIRRFTSTRKDKNR